jgi:hypothetical protein
MSSSSLRTLANVIRIGSIALLIVVLCGMLGWIPKLPGYRTLPLFIVVLLILARQLKRRASRAQPSP